MTKHIIATTAPQPRPGLMALEASKIREVANVGASFSDVIPLWFGEPDVVTPDFVREAAKKSLDAGETFYGANLGFAPLRIAIADYHGRTGCQVDASRVFVTASGVNALMLCAQAVVDPNDRVVIPSPHWPHLAEIPRILGARPETVNLRLAAGKWRIDIEELCSAITPGTRLVVINSPANPTGWTMQEDEQRLLLDRCRQTGTWILADEVYSRIYFKAPRAPSFLDICNPDDRVLVVNSFSKSWAMTGWRLGWVVAPPTLIETMAKLNEYNMSSPSIFVQRGGVAALEHGDTFLLSLVDRFRDMRDLCVDLIGEQPRVTMPKPDGAMYAFFKIEDMSDSLAFAKDLVVKGRVGLAPGSAFGPAGEGYLRLCFAGTRERLTEACSRLNTFLQSAGRY
jgi:aspartate/methionine/tyrosine aminotransferase